MLYTGSHKLEDLNLIQPNELGMTVSKWEDGARTTGKSNDVVEGVINVKYNNYKINLDLPDRLFKKAPEKRD